MGAQKTALRWINIVLALASIALLWMISWQAWERWDRKVYSEQEVVHAKQQLDEYTRLNAEYQSFERYQALRQELSNKLKQGDLSAGFWDKRHVLVNDEELTRSKVQDYLTGLGRESSYLFIPESLVIKTSAPHESLFSWSAGSADRLKFTLEGDYFMRREQ